jgi:hypothetical protein
MAWILDSSILKPSTVEHCPFGLTTVETEGYKLPVEDRSTNWTKGGIIMKTLPAIICSMLLCCCSGLHSNSVAPVGSVKGNIFSYRDTVVKVNPDFKTLYVSDKFKVPDTEDIRLHGMRADTYVFFGVNSMNRVEKAAVIDVFTFTEPYFRWDHRGNLLDGIKALEKGIEVLDGKNYWCWTANIKAIPEKLLFAAEEEGYQIANFRCGMERGVARLVGKDASALLTIRYLEGLLDCSGLNPLVPEAKSQLKNLIDDIKGQFGDNVYISHQ